MATHDQGRGTTPEQAVRLLSIDQLHAAVLATGQNCFELKRLCATILLPAAVLIQNFAKPRAEAGGDFIDAAIYVAALLIVLVFWAADTVSYYYQAQLRIKMNGVAREWQREAGSGMPIDLTVPAGSAGGVSALEAAFNKSMIFYYSLMLADLGLYLAWRFELYAI